MPAQATVAFDNSYARLPDRFFARVSGRAASAPRLLALNETLAAELGLDPAWLRTGPGLDLLCGRALPSGADPIAMVYAGHQFGHFSPRLGDGRAMLVGELVDRDGVRRDLQLKGSGPTPFSRNGDGLAAIGPVLREYIVSEAMAALGIPSTRALAATLTGDAVMREGPRPGAVFARVASSHVRFGTFQYFRSIGDHDALRTLCDYVIDRHYPDAPDALALLDAVTGRFARLVAHWQSVGFIHGVLNTDNMSIAAETIDFGPCAFMEAYHPATAYSAIDAQGRYAYANQPGIVHWNLTRLAEALLPLLGDEVEAAVAAARSVLETFPARYERARTELFARKLGLAAPEPDDAALIDDLLVAMAENRADFTNTFRRLDDPSMPQDLFADPAALAPWLARLHARRAREDLLPERRTALMAVANPALIARNHRVEQALSAAERGDLAPFHALCAALAEPYRDDPRTRSYAEPARPEEEVRQTFCGT